MIAAGCVDTWQSRGDGYACDGRPVYGLGGLDGPDGRIGGQDTTSRDWTEQTDGSLHVAKVRVAGSNPVVRSSRTENDAVRRANGSKDNSSGSIAKIAFGGPGDCIAEQGESSTQRERCGLRDPTRRLAR